MTETLYSLEVEDLPEGYIPLGAVILLKALDGEGNVVTYFPGYSGITVWERIGMLTVALDNARDEAAAGSLVHDEEYDGEEDE